MIDTVWHSCLQGKDARGFDPKTQLEGGWNATFAILVSQSIFMQFMRQRLTLRQLINKDYATRLPHSLKYFVVSIARNSRSLTAC